MIGLSTLGENSVVVDHDLVVMSNLSRQVCFGEKELAKEKAISLCNNARSMFNSHIRYLTSAVLSMLFLIALQIDP